MNKVNDIFLLLLNLSQLHDRDIIMRRYLESVNTLFSPLIFNYKKVEISSKMGEYAIATRNNTYGELKQVNDGLLNEEDSILFHNSLQMLAIILERVTLEKKLEDECVFLDSKAQERLNNLQESYVLLQIAGETAKFGGWSIDLNTKRVTWSDQVAKIHQMPIGYSPLVDEGINFYAPEWREKITAAFTACANKGVSYDEEMEIITAKGHRCWVRTVGQAVKDENGNIVKIQGAFQDIDKYKKNEIAVIESERQMKTLLANLPGMAYRCKIDQKWTMEFVSQGCLTLTGYASSDLINNKRLSYEDLIHPDDRKMVRNVILEAVNRHEKFILEYRIRDATGKEKWVWEKGQVVPRGRKDEQMLEGFITDITARKLAEAKACILKEELEQRVKERTIELEAVNKELEAFAYSVSHDFRTPLRALDGFSEYLVDSYTDQLDEKGKHYLKRIRKAALYMSDLIDDLLKLSRVTRSDLNKECVDLSHIAADVLAALQESEPERQVEAIIAPNLTIIGDPHLMRLMLENILANAWKFSAREQQAIIEVGQTKINEEKAFFVRDNGVGFCMTYVNKLFGAFQRLHGSDEFPGTGIGLATVQRIINRHGGRIWAESEVGKGASFFFTLGMKK